MALINSLLVTEDGQDILGVRFSYFVGSIKKFVDLPIEDIPREAFYAIIDFPPKYLYENGDYLSTMGEIKSGELVSTAEGDMKNVVLSIFDDIMFKTSRLGTITDVLELALIKGVSLKHMQELHLCFAKAVPPDRLMALLQKTELKKTEKYVFMSLLKTFGGQLEYSKSDVAKFIQKHQHSKNELVSLRSLNLAMDKGFDSMTYFYNIPVSIKEVADVEGALRSFLGSFGVDSSPVVCTGRGEFTTPFGICVMGEVLMASNSTVYSTAVDGDIMIPKVHIDKLVTKVGNYETAPAVLEKGRKPRFKEIIVKPKKAVSFWVYNSEPEVKAIIDKLAQELGLTVKHISM